MRDLKMPAPTDTAAVILNKAQVNAHLYGAAFPSGSEVRVQGMSRALSEEVPACQFYALSGKTSLVSSKLVVSHWPSILNMDWCGSPVASPVSIAFPSHVCLADAAPLPIVGSVPPSHSASRGDSFVLPRSSRTQSPASAVAATTISGASFVSPCPLHVSRRVFAAAQRHGPAPGLPYTSPHVAIASGVPNFDLYSLGAKSLEVAQDAVHQQSVFSVPSQEYEGVVPSAAPHAQLAGCPDLSPPCRLIEVCRREDAAQHRQSGFSLQVQDKTALNVALPASTPGPASCQLRSSYMGTSPFVSGPTGLHVALPASTLLVPGSFCSPPISSYMGTAPFVTGPSSQLGLSCSDAGPPTGSYGRITPEPAVRALPPAWARPGGAAVARPNFFDNLDDIRAKAWRQADRYEQLVMGRS